MIFLQLLLSDGVCGRWTQTVLGCGCTGLNQFAFDHSLDGERQIPMHDEPSLASQGVVFLTAKQASSCLSS